MNIEKRIIKMIGIQKCENDLRDAIEHAIYNGSALWWRNEKPIANIEIVDDQSDLPYNSAATYCCIAKITALRNKQTVYVGYYSDNALHALDIVDKTTTVCDWAKMWDNDGIVPLYFNSRGIL